MCYEQVGKEMDRLIAEKLMGWQVKKTVGSDGAEEWWIPQKVACIVKAPWSGMVFMWNPSTDVKAAWDVVEKLRQMGWLVRVQAMPDGILPSGKPAPAYIATGVYIKGHSSDDRSEIEKYVCSDFNGYGTTAPEAICRLALEILCN
ncbi:hypothetical protein Desku_0772 [Desulfofundulus kuznetsovii DSM 6115]|uniref:Phage ABA sandwich domain-containing protein n=1 Tax=Desulfofundulus kuznetsovii (strain DSM 6115 / VKM B-1805 / 17) TaxID=760568 RepID=A0AAU8PX31_DESK7|nr:hypothetical protein Desku_0772 [Desulfofundulus kuznetsovii DSM 6115]